MKKYKPILFSQELLKAIVDGNKTQTRRPSYIDDRISLSDVTIEQSTNNKSHFYLFKPNERHDLLCYRSPYSIGDILYIRETFSEWRSNEYQYKLDTPAGAALGIWKPSIHMPRSAAKYFIRITNVRLEKLKNITEEDAIKEGVVKYGPFGEYKGAKRGKFKETGIGMEFNAYRSPIDAFLNIWHSIYTDTPRNNEMLVCVYDFELIDKPKDFCND
ncbi:hypothetical protein [Myroides odoratimimus]|uniref:hypothetical protein n=1 Tax=Myroides odoratimimus TaxID=76832 RepID=UPI0025790EB7|nr:hypothetical protein [Myroides odoratimimus]MDM1529020.1 hypothetical protein [Myroides odoratimimus]